MSAVAKIAKPAMRGMHIASIKKNLVMATVVSRERDHAFIISYYRIIKYFHRSPLSLLQPGTWESTSPGKKPTLTSTPHMMLTRISRGCWYVQVYLIYFKLVSHN